MSFIQHKFGLYYHDMAKKTGWSVVNIVWENKSSYFERKFNMAK